MPIEEFEKRLRHLEEMVQRHEIELNRSAPLILKTHEDVRAVVDLLRGVLGSKGLITEFNSLQVSFHKEITSLKRKQYILMGGITVIVAVIQWLPNLMAGM